MYYVSKQVADHQGPLVLGSLVPHRRRLRGPPEPRPELSMAAAVVGQRDGVHLHTQHVCVAAELPRNELEECEVQYQLATNRGLLALIEVHVLARIQRQRALVAQGL